MKKVFFCLLLIIFLLIILISVVLVNPQVIDEISGDDVIIGSDIFNSSAVINIRIDSNEIRKLELSGHAIIIETGNPVMRGGTTTIPVEIVAMQLSGVSNTFGQVTITENPNVNSRGEIKFRQVAACLVRPLNSVKGESLINVSAIINVENPNIEKKLNITLNGTFNATKERNVFPTTNLKFNASSKEVRTGGLRLKVINSKMGRVLTPGDSFYDTNFYDTVIRVKTVAQAVENAIMTIEPIDTCTNCIVDCGDVPLWEVVGKVNCVKNCLASNACPQDRDEDGVPDINDNCPNNFNPDQFDLDENGIGDECDKFLCCLGDLGENCFPATIKNCREQGGAVMDCLPKEVEGDIPIEELRNFTRTRFNASDSALVNLSRDVISTGVNNTVYTPRVYNCANFSGDLERNLTALGYNATFTGYWCYGGAGNPPVANHAVVDVHLQDGRTVFIEPQTNQIINLDFDGDGQVEVNNNAYTSGRNMGQTDDNCKISVFDNQAAAQAAGAPGA